MQNRLELVWSSLRYYSSQPSRGIGNGLDSGVHFDNGKFELGPIRQGARRPITKALRLRINAKASGISPRPLVTASDCSTGRAITGRIRLTEAGRPYVGNFTLIRL